MSPMLSALADISRDFVSAGPRKWMAMLNNLSCATRANIIVTGKLSFFIEGMIHAFLGVLMCKRASVN